MTRLAGVLAALSVVVAAWTGVASAAAGVGTLEICKVGVNGTNVAGSTFTFTVQKGLLGTPQTVAVSPPGCSHTSLPVGNYTITENLSSGGLDYVQTGATTIPEGALISEVAASAKTKVALTAGADVVVTISNQLAASVVKVCKTTSAAAFNKAQYAFTIAGTPVTAIANGACSAAIGIQAGSVITVAEQVPDGQQVTSIKNSGGTIRRQVTPSSIRFVVGNGANVITFDNEPLGPPQTGLLEICKSAADQFVSATTPFQFTVTDANSTQKVGVLAGQCSAPLTVAAGNVNVAEDIPDGERVSSIALGFGSSGQLGLTNLVNGTALVVVPLASSGEAEVVFTNATLTTTLKVCKFLTLSSGALTGQQFKFAVTDDAFAPGTSYPVTIVATAAGTGACKIVTSGGSSVLFPIGSRATAVEDLSGLPFVAGDNAPRGTNDTQSIKVTSGVNAINFINQAFGLFEICKNLGDADRAYTNFTFTFSYVNTADKTIKGTTTAAVGHCSFPVIVPPGTYTITEDVLNPPGFDFVSSTATGPTGDTRCSPQPNCGNPLTITVPYYVQTSDPVNYGETRVDIVDRVARASFKICKVIEAHSTAALKNLSFTFDYSWTNGPSGTVTINPPYSPVGSDGSLGSCTGLIGNIPLIQPDGTQTQVTVQERILGLYKVSLITLDRGVVVTNAPPKIVYKPLEGPAVVTFTNTSAAGSLRICKTLSPDDAAYTNFTFSFHYVNTLYPSVNGDVSVGVGKCTVVAVPIGSYAISENVTTPAGFEFVSSAATGPSGDNRCVPPQANCGNPLTVNVPEASETRVDVVDRVQRASLQVCKVIPAGTEGLDQNTYTFDFTWTNGPMGTVTIGPPFTTINDRGDKRACAMPITGIPVIQPDGTRTKVAVQEQLNGNYAVTSITLDRGDVVTNAPPLLVYNPVPGASVATFTNGPSGGTVQGSCLASSSLAVLVQGTDVVAYVPKGSWSNPVVGVGAVNVEGTSITNTLIPTTGTVNSCASNWTTGKTVCVTNGTDIYVISGTAIGATRTSGATGFLRFSGGICLTCGVTMDAVNNRAWMTIGMSSTSPLVGGFQYLDLTTNTLASPFLSLAPVGSFFANVSEDALIDPIRNLILSANENNNYELIDVSTPGAPRFYENAIPGPGNTIADSSAEDCSTGIVLAPYEQGGITVGADSAVYLADISNPTFAPFTGGTPGTWTAPQQVQTLLNSKLNAGPSGLAIAQGTHTGVLTGEFAGDAITAIGLPATSGANATPAIQPYLTCNIGGGFALGLDPHTVTAYRSPSNGHAIALIANVSGSVLARIDLTLMLGLPETAVGSHLCSGGTLPGSVVTFIPVP